MVFLFCTPMASTCTTNTPITNDKQQNNVSYKKAAASSRQEGAGSARSVSVPDFSNKSSVRFGSENQCSRFDAVRPSLFGRIAAGSGSVRFVFAAGSGRFQNSTVRFGSVRPVWFGFLFIPGYKIC